MRCLLTKLRRRKHMSIISMYKMLPVCHAAAAWQIMRRGSQQRWLGTALWQSCQERSLPVDCLLLRSTVCCPRLSLSDVCHAAAEGEGYGSGKAYGNSSAYLAFAGLQTGLAGLMAALPESVRPVRPDMRTACLGPCQHVYMLHSAALPWAPDKLTTFVM